MNKITDINIDQIMEVWKQGNSISLPEKKEILLEFIKEIAELFAAGSYYYYILSFETLKMELVSENVRQFFGIAPEDYTLEELLNRIHPDDVIHMQKKEQNAIKFLLETIPPEQLPHYKVAYTLRFRDLNNNYRTILHQTKTIVVSKDGKIQKVIGIHTDISHLSISIDTKISYLSEKYPSYYSYENSDEFILIEKIRPQKFTSRELEIIKLLAKGLTFKEIAAKIFVSPHTINTHKRNILAKTSYKNITHLVSDCVRQGLI